MHISVLSEIAEETQRRLAAEAAAAAERAKADELARAQVRTVHLFQI
jgi:hypothetical protein